MFWVVLYYIMQCVRFRPINLPKSLKYGKLKSTNGPFLIHVNYKIVNAKLSVAKHIELIFVGCAISLAIEMDNFRCHLFVYWLEWLKTMQIEWKRLEKMEYSNNSYVQMCLPQPKIRSYNTTKPNAIANCATAMWNLCDINHRVMVGCRVLPILDATYISVEEHTLDLQVYQSECLLTTWQNKKKTHTQTFHTSLIW